MGWLSILIVVVVTQDCTWYNCTDTRTHIHAHRESMSNW